MIMWQMTIASAANHFWSQTVSLYDIEAENLANADDSADALERKDFLD